MTAAGNGQMPLPGVALRAKERKYGRPGAGDDGEPAGCLPEVHRGHSQVTAMGAWGRSSRNRPASRSAASVVVLIMVGTLVA